LFLFLLLPLFLSVLSCAGTGLTDCSFGVSDFERNHEAIPRMPNRTRGHGNDSLSDSKDHPMKTPEYIEGPKALENFERGMIALFKVPKTAIGNARKKGRKLTAPRKKKRSDKD